MPSNRCWRTSAKAGATSDGSFSIPSTGSVGYASYRFSFQSRRPEAKGARVVFDGIGRFDLEGSHIRRYSEVFDRGMALAQQEFEPNVAPDRPEVCAGPEGAQ